jgi:7,8-dihydropterin-6-yl-methyl-4-(beta-D-ribofuranosyl)aminobenzene 5'-phosphate synthase
MRTGNMRVTILYDNETDVEGLQADWGFSCLVNQGGINLLFDTGANGAILLKNMWELGIEPGSIDIVFISHAHFDHAGGLSSFLNENHDVTVYAPATLRGIRSAREVVYVDRPVEIGGDFYSTGLLDNMEQSLVVRAEEGLMVIVGCSHPGVTTILEAAERYGTPATLIGGLHDFREFEALQALRLVCPTHCTEHIDEIRSRYPDEYIRGGVGVSIDI